MKKTRVLLLLLLALTISAFAQETKTTCQVDDDCSDLHNCVENVCVHKLLFPITFREVISTFFILLLNATMTAGGVGGGAAYVPYIMVLFQKPLKQAIYIGYTCVFGGGLGNLVNILTLKNHKTNRYMINYNTNMIILPALMVGVLIGVIINRMLPPFVTNLILLAVLFFSLYKNFHKLRINLAKEKKERAQHHAASLKIQQKPTPTTESPQDEENNTPKNEQQNEAVEMKDGQKYIAIPTALTSNMEVQVSNNVSEKDKPSDEIPAEILKREELYKREQKYPFRKLLELLVNVVIIIVIGLIRGSKSFTPVVGVNWSCGWDFLWFGIAVFAFLLILLRSIHLTYGWQKEKAKVGFEFLPEDLVLNRSRIIKLTIGSIYAGIIGALIALGGALIIGPILLDMHVPPAFSAATTGLFMVFSMFNAMYQTILDGKLQWQELAWFLPLSFVFSYASSRLVHWYVKKTGRQSTVILAVMTGVTLGSICLLVLFIKSIVDDFMGQVQFTSIC